jgi:hypothetical protein
MASLEKKIQLKLYHKPKKNKERALWNAEAKKTEV